MDALLMCGGRGTRLGSGEKPLRRVAGRPMVDRVADALAGSVVETVYAVTSSHAPETAAHLDLPVIKTPGEGYVPDLQAALASDRVDQPVLTAAADLPLLEPAVVDRVLAERADGALTPVVPAGRVRALGFSVDATVRHRGMRVRPAGINVVAPGGDRSWVARDRRLAANVNRPGDLATAAWHLAGER